MRIDWQSPLGAGRMVESDLDHRILAGTAADFAAEGEGMLGQLQTGVLGDISVQSLGFAVKDIDVD